MKKTMQEAISRVHEQTQNLAPKYLSQSADKKGYICPFCGHGKGGDGITINPKGGGSTFHCFGCAKDFDIIDIRQQQTGEDFTTAVRELARSIGIEIEDDGKGENKPRGSSERKPAPAPTFREKQPVPETAGDEEKPENIERSLAYFLECTRRIEDPAALEYLRKRGISLQTAKNYCVGFDPKANTAKEPWQSASGSYFTPRLIIPADACNSSFYVARATDGSEPRCLNGGKVAFFNAETLYNGDSKAVFVTEGAIDALSVIEVGGDAIGLNGTPNAKKLVEMLREQPTHKVLVLALDNDKPGQNAAETLAAELQTIEANFIVVNVAGAHKDPNEALVSDRGTFTLAVRAAIKEAGGSIKPDNTSRYLETLFSNDVNNFKSEISTGFSYFDKKMGGGMNPGLYILAAISSLGKSTFALQLADNVAAAGDDVLYFSLEMSKLEMVSKSLSRIMAEQGHPGITSLAIRRGDWQHDRLQSAWVQQAISEYKCRMGDRMSIIESNFSASITFIESKIKGYCLRTGKKPLVVLDYLQIITPEKDKLGRTQTGKDAVDSTVTALKRLSRELGLTIIAVCSMNRMNYNSPVSFEGLKESGSIEYTADVVWGLQPHSVTEKFDDEDEAAKVKDNTAGKVKQRQDIEKSLAKKCRSVDLVWLKNRFGTKSGIVSFEFYTTCDTFIELPEALQPVISDDD